MVLSLVILLLTVFSRGNIINLDSAPATAPHQYDATVSVGDEVKVTGAGQTDCFLIKSSEDNFALFTYETASTAALSVTDLTVLVRSQDEKDGVFVVDQSGNGGSVTATFLRCRFTMAAAVTGVPAPTVGSVTVKDPSTVYGAFYIDHADKAASLRLEHCLVDEFVLGLNKLEGQSFIKCYRINSLEIVDSVFANMRVETTTSSTMGNGFGGVCFNVEGVIKSLLVSRSVFVGIMFWGEVAGLTASVQNHRGGGVGYLVDGSMVGQEIDNVMEDSQFWNCTCPSGSGGAVLKIGGDFIAENAGLKHGITITNVSCVDCKSTSTNSRSVYGGAFALLRNVGAEFYLCSFVRCGSTNAGAAIGIRFYTSTSTAESTIDNCTFIECGNSAITIYERIVLKVKDCVFYNNFASVGGLDIDTGGIASTGCNLTVVNSYSYHDSLVTNAVSCGSTAVQCNPYTASGGGSYPCVQTDSECAMPAAIQEAQCATGSVLAGGVCVPECLYYWPDVSGGDPVECVQTCPAGQEARVELIGFAGLKRKVCALPSCDQTTADPAAGCRIGGVRTNCYLSPSGVCWSACPPFSIDVLNDHVCVWEGKDCAVRTPDTTTVAGEGRCGADTACYYFSAAGTGNYTDAAYTPCIAKCPDDEYEGVHQGAGTPEERYYCELKDENGSPAKGGLFSKYIVLFICLLLVAYF